MFRKIITILILLGLTIPAVYAEDQNPQNANWYQINVIVFEHITPTNLGSEHWPAVTNLPDISNAVTPDLLPSKQSQLNLDAMRLQRRQDYKVLANMSWQQQIPVTEDSQPIHIVGGDNYDGVNQLDGTITINRATYFEISTNLVLTESTKYLNTIGSADYAKETINSQYKNFLMQENLRLRSKETGYFDHPLFGVLIKIMPIKPPANSAS